MPSATERAVVVMTFNKAFLPYINDKISCVSVEAVHLRLPNAKTLEIVPQSFFRQTVSIHKAVNLLGFELRTFRGSPKCHRGLVKPVWGILTHIGCH